MNGVKAKKKIIELKQVKKLERLIEELVEEKQLLEENVSKLRRDKLITTSKAEHICLILNPDREFNEIFSNENLNEVLENLRILVKVILHDNKSSSAEIKILEKQNDALSGKVSNSLREINLLESENQQLKEELIYQLN